MTISNIGVTTIDGRATTLNEWAGKALLIVNVASKCGLTPQYTKLEQLQEKYGDRGFAVLGFPCNQFKGQEPGTNDEIAQFCSATYGVTFPLFEKVDVNGPARHPLYDALTATTAEPEENNPSFPFTKFTPDDISWNFEKFVISPSGDVVKRFAPQVQPDDSRVVKAIESLLPA